MPAQITLTNGGETMGFLPTRYSGSESSPDNGIRLARKTEWRALAGDTYAGIGQRVLSSDRDEVGLLDVRELTLNAAA